LQRTLQAKFQLYPAVKKHIIIFSHGFGVRKDDRGLLTDIASALPECEAILFDYFDVDEVGKTLTIRPLSVQAKMLSETVAQVRASNPEAVIDLIGHSQGTVVAALAQPEGIRKTILLAPVFDMSIERAAQRYGALLNLEGTTTLYPLDGFTRLVPPEYWAERRNLDTFKAYNFFAEKTELIIIEANQDEVVPKVSLDNLSPKIKQSPLDGDHNFTGTAREPLKRALQSILSAAA